jgi:hypothetical protein
VVLTWSGGRFDPWFGAAPPPDDTGCYSIFRFGAPANRRPRPIGAEGDEGGGRTPTTSPTSANVALVTRSARRDGEADH